MIALGAGLYLAYTPFNALLFDRFIAASGRTGTAGFLIYVADACGYVSSVALLVFRNFVGARLSWVQFLIHISYVSAVGRPGPVVAAGLYFHRHLQRVRPRCSTVQPRGDRTALRRTRRRSTTAKTSPSSSTPCSAPAWRRPPARAPSLIVAALLHDVGHLFETEAECAARDDRHEVVGARRSRACSAGGVRARSPCMWRPSAISASRSQATSRRAEPGVQSSLQLQGGAFDAAARPPPSSALPYWREAVAFGASMTWASARTFAAAPSPTSRR